MGAPSGIISRNTIYSGVSCSYLQEATCNAQPTQPIYYGILHHRIFTHTSYNISYNGRKSLNLSSRLSVLLYNNNNLNRTLTGVYNMLQVLYNIRTKVQKIRRPGCERVWLDRTGKSGKKRQQQKTQTHPRTKARRPYHTCGPASMDRSPYTGSVRSRSTLLVLRRFPVWIGSTSSEKSGAGMSSTSKTALSTLR